VLIKSDRNRATFDDDRSGHLRVWGIPSSCISSDIPEPYTYLQTSVSPPETSDNKTGAIVGAVVAAALVVGLLFLWYYKRQTKTAQVPSVPASQVTGDFSGNDKPDSTPRRSDQAIIILPTTAPNSPSPPSRPPNRMPNFKNQVYSESTAPPLEGASELQEEEGARSVVALPEDSQLAVSTSELPQPATVHVLDDGEEIRRMSDSKVRTQDTAIPVALTFKLDDGEKK